MMEQIRRAVAYPLSLKVMSWAGSAVTILGGGGGAAVVVAQQPASPQVSPIGAAAAGVGVASIFAGIITAFMPLYFRDRSERRNVAKVVEDLAAANARAAKLEGLVERAHKHIRRLTNESLALKAETVALKAGVQANSGLIGGHDGKLDSHRQRLVELGVIAAPDAAAPRGTAFPTVLLVEDNPDVARAFNKLLGDEGFRVEQASAVADAMQLLDDNPMWILLDLVLPDGSGLDVFREARRRGLKARVGVITGAPDDADRMREARELKPDAIWKKPVKFAELLAVLKGHAEAGPI